MYQRDRRMFLRMAGGGLFALPFLPSMFVSCGAQAQMPAKALKRLILLHGYHHSLGSLSIPDLSTGAWGNGDPSFLQTNMADGRRAGVLPADIGKAGGLFDIPALTVGSDAARLRQEMLVVNGLVSPRQEYGHFRNYFGINADNRDPAKLRNGKATPCIDHIIADHLQPGAYPIIIGESGTGPNVASIDLGGNGVKSKTPDQAYTAYFATYTGYPAPAGSPLDHRKLLHGSLLNMAAEQRASLAAHPRLSAGDKSRLGSYFDAISDLEKRIAAQKSVSAQCTKPSLPVASTREVRWSGGNLTASTDVDVHVAWIKAALICDVSPVINIFGLTHDRRFLDGPVAVLEKAFQNAGYISNDGQAEEHAYFHTAGYDAKYKGFYMAEMEAVVRIAQEVASLRDTEGEDMLKSTLMGKILFSEKGKLILRVHGFNFGGIE